MADATDDAYPAVKHDFETFLRSLKLAKAPGPEAKAASASYGGAPQN